MLDKNTPRRGTQCFRRQHELAVFQAEHLSAYDTCHSDPVCKSQRQYYGLHTGTDDHHDQDHVQRHRNRVNHVHNAHHDRVHISTLITCKAAVEHTNDKVDQCGKNTDRQGHACAINHADKQISSKRVAAQKKGLVPNRLTLRQDLPRIGHAALIDFFIQNVLCLHQGDRGILGIVAEILGQVFRRGSRNLALSRIFLFKRVIVLHRLSINAVIDDQFLTVEVVNAPSVDHVLVSGLEQLNQFSVGRHFHGVIALGDIDADIILVVLNRIELQDRRRIGQRKRLIIIAVPPEKRDQHRAQHQ